ncbi:MAG: SsrA-binding protein SmpB [Candidatus Pacebacteria bacterium]|nr:SsrA-binding protein SmpB [Candidatus Paceibacterota bacterium]MCD8527812.1 SsrA-binding protein SmpB [Candidatus Paceibacterota bacterium]MCD8563428.1 SsrA-binding protein SmpB [Candidatus Paceibacterota bacterium]
MALLQNKYAGSQYEIIDTFEAGIVLHGFEVKSLKNQQGSLKEAYATIDSHNEVFLVKAHIPPYQQNNTPPTYDPYRRRKLLLKKSEIDRMIKAKHTQGLTLIPISLYNKGRQIKAQIALARGLKKHDKREKLKQKDAERDMQRLMKR